MDLMKIQAQAMEEASQLLVEDISICIQGQRQGPNVMTDSLEEEGEPEMQFHACPIVIKKKKEIPAVHGTVGVESHPAVAPQMAELTTYHPYSEAELVDLVNNSGKRSVSPWSPGLCSSGTWEQMVKCVQNRKWRGQSL